MRAKGITYDTGFAPSGHRSRTEFDAASVARDMRVIAEELRCTAVRITGEDPQRLSVAAHRAAEVGLEVWFSPFPCEMTADEMLPYLADCAERAERVRAAGAEVVFVTGCEVSLFARGFLPGGSSHQRIAALGSGDPRTWESLAEAPGKVRAFLAAAAGAARRRFDGPVTYAAGMWEDVDWGPFDVVAADAYRTAENAARFPDEVAALAAHGKPVAVAEFGCCTYRGAGARGGMGWAIVERSATRPRLAGDFARDETEQVRYLNESLAVFEAAGVDAAFWFTFAGWHLPHRPADPEHDLDVASFGAVAVTEDGWRPKEVFHALAAWRPQPR